MGSDITVIIPHIPPRNVMLTQRPLPSVFAQTLHPDDVLIVTDNDKDGAGPTRNRGIAMASTEWVAFLDDDDELEPRHLEVCKRHAEETGADVVWPWYTMGDPRNTDPLPADFFGRQWNPDAPHTFPITALVRTSWAKQVEFRPPARRGFSGEDWFFWCELSVRGAKFSHVAERTWKDWHHFHNTSGSPTRW